MVNFLIIFAAQYLLFASLGAAIVFWVKLSRKEKIVYGQLIVTAGIIALIVAAIASRLYYDPRPFTQPGVSALIPHAVDNGFPSDHTLLAATIAFVTVLFSKKLGVFLLVNLFLIGVARVAAQVHSPIDIVGAAAIAGVAVMGARIIIERYPLTKVPSTASRKI